MRSNLYHNKKNRKEEQEKKQYIYILSVATTIKISTTYIDKASNTLWVNSTYPFSAKLLNDLQYAVVLILAVFSPKIHVQRICSVICLQCEVLRTLKGRHMGGIQVIDACSCRAFWDPVTPDTPIIIPCIQQQPNL